jgi:thioredoxin-like negative regulator of GroEL
MALKHFNSDQLDATISSGDLTLVYFWTDWHERCAMSTPIMEELATKYEGQAHIVAINADAEGFLALELGALSIPTVILFENGEEIDRIAGVQPLELYASLLDVRLSPEEINPYDIITSMGYMN